MPSQRFKRLRAALACLLLAVAVWYSVLWLLCYSLAGPARQAIPAPPADPPTTNVEFSSAGQTLRGWWLPGVPGKGAVVLMHGVRANRLAMLERAKFLHKAGFSILLFDFQAHGESAGRRITFGHLESRNAQAAVDFVQRRTPGEHIGVIGISLGGAAAILATPRLNVDAMVLESVYPAIDQAIFDRLAMRLPAPFPALLTPFLTSQLPGCTACDTARLRPIDSVRTIAAPKFFIAGSEDRHTTLREAKQLFEAAREPKQLWIIPGAAHIDLHRFGVQEYERRVLAFLEPRLAKAPAATACSGGFNIQAHAPPQSPADVHQRVE